MKATIDSSRCEGRGYCSRFAPEVFGLDEDGWSTVLIPGELPESELANARSAFTACPEQAITLHEA